jgi:hypothetical protein
MCFSASASFISGGVLAAIGGYSVASNKNRTFLPFAAIPFYFAFQQFIEGLIWLSFTEPSVHHWQHELTYVFLLFAQVVWPIYVPWSIYVAEKNEKTKKILLVILGVGVVVGGYLAFCLAAYPVSVKIQGNHILYLLDYPEFNLNYKGILYFIATVFPPFFSTLKGMRWFGVMVFISLMITQIFFPGFEISVWCFFAALISACIPIILHASNKHHKVIPVE